MFREIKAAVDCKNDLERDAVQEVVKRLCNKYHPTAEDIIEFYSMYDQNEELFSNVINTLKRDGKKGLVKLVPTLMKMF